MACCRCQRSPQLSPWLTLFMGTLTFVVCSEGAWHALPVFHYLYMSIACSLLPAAAGKSVALAQAFLQDAIPNEGTPPQQALSECRHILRSPITNRQLQAPLLGTDIQSPDANMPLCCGWQWAAMALHQQYAASVPPPCASHAYQDHSRRSACWG